MGAGQIIESNIKSATTSLWEKVPQIGEKAWLDFDLKNYSRPFVNLAVAAGAIVAIGSTVKLAAKAIKLAQIKKVPTSKQLHDKFGHHSWALIADCRGTEDYAQFLAKNGFNLILLGLEKDVKQTRERVEALNPQISIQIESIPVNWKKQEANLKWYEALLERLKQHDISLLILPRMQKKVDPQPSHLQHVQPFVHIYLLTRYLGEKMAWRSYHSGIIFPSHLNYSDVSADNGITKGIIAGVDAFGRIMHHEQHQNFLSVVARGSVENAFIGLGNVPITY